MTASGRDNTSCLLEGAKFADHKRFFARSGRGRLFTASAALSEPVVTGDRAVVAVSRNLCAAAGSCVAPLDIRPGASRRMGRDRTT